MYAGLAFMLACAAAAVALGLDQEASLAPYIAGAGVLAYFVATIVAMIPQAVTIAIDGDTVTPSWRPAFRMRERPELASWVVPGIDAAMGLAVTIRGQGGAIRIGGNGHDGEGYELSGRPQRTVDCHLDKSELDALLGALRVTRGKVGPLAVPLVRNRQTLGGVARSMLPWILTIGVFGLTAVVVGSTEAGRQLSRSPDGQVAMAIASGAIALIGVAWMVISARRRRVPELELRFGDDALIVIETRSAVETRVPWSAVTIEKLTYTASSRVGSYPMPVLVIGLGDGDSLRLGTWDTTLAWPGHPAKTWRGPTWLVGAVKWPRFLDAMKRHGRG